MNQSITPTRRVRTPQAASIVGLSTSTLEQDRITGRLKIPFLKLGRAVLYDVAELENWLRQHRRNSTSEYFSGGVL